MAILCRDIGLLLLQAPHTGSTSLGTLLRTELGGEMLVEERVRDARGRIVLRQKHQTLAQLMAAGLVTPEQRANLLVVVGIRNPFDLVLTEYARNREAGSISAPQRLLRRLPGASRDFSPRDFERFVQRRYEPGRLFRLPVAGPSYRPTGRLVRTTSSASSRCRRTSTPPCAGSASRSPTACRIATPPPRGPTATTVRSTRSVHAPSSAVSMPGNCASTGTRSRVEPGRARQAQGVRVDRACWLASVDRPLHPASPGVA